MGCEIVYVTGQYLLLQFTELFNVLSQQPYVIIVPGLNLLLTI